MALVAVFLSAGPHRTAPPRSSRLAAPLTARTAGRSAVGGGARSPRRRHAAAVALAAARRSQSAFARLTPAASRRLAGHDFGAWLAEKTANPAASVAADGAVVDYPAPNRALVRTPHGLALETASVPLRVAAASGAEQPVSLSMRASRGAYVAANPLAAVTVAGTLAGGVSVGGNGIRVLPGGADAHGSLIGARGVFFADVAHDEDALIAPTIRGADLAAVLRASASPQQIPYTVLLPAGAKLQASDGGASVMRGGRAIARIPAPMARDAEGNAVPASLTVAGDRLLVDVAHRGAAVDYPVLVDPEVLTITESAENWHFEGEGGGSAPGGGSPVITEESGTYPPREHCFPRREECGNFRSEGAWEWKVAAPLTPATVATNLAAEFDDVTLSESVSGETSGVEESPRDVGWGLSTTCGPKAGGGEGGDREHPPASFVQVDAGGCDPTGERTVSVGVEVGQNHAFRFGFEGPVPQVSASGTLSVGAILLSESLPPTDEEGSEMYGTGNAGEPARSDCVLGEGVNCATGNYVLTQSDLEVGGRGPGLHLERTYNSQLAVAEEQSGREAPTLGYGWSSSYSAHLELGVRTAIVHQDNASTVPFREETDGEYVATSPLVHATLAKDGGDYLYTLPNQLELLFGPTGLLLSETDRNGNAVRLLYEKVPCEESHADARPAAAGSGSCPEPAPERIAAMVDGAGRKITFAYSEGDLLTSVTDPIGHTVHYGYSKGNLVSVTEPGETRASWQFGYDSAHRMTSRTDALGHRAMTEYEGANRVIEQTDAQGRKRSWSYNGDEVTVSEPNGSSTVATTNPEGLQLSLTAASGTPLAATTSYEYDGAGNLLAITRPDAQKTTYTYNSAGDQTSETDALGHTSEATYDAANDLTSSTTRGGEKTTIVRDARGNVLETSRPSPAGPQVRKYSYEANGDLRSVTDPLGRTTSYEYDGFGDAVAEIDPEGDKQTFTYDGDSEEISTTSPLGSEPGDEAAAHTTTIERDPQGRVVAVIEPPTGAGETTRPIEARKQIGAKGKRAGQLSGPDGVAVDSLGDLWIADTKNDRVEELSETGSFIRELGSKGSGAGQLDSPENLALDSRGDVLVADTKNNRIDEFGPEGEAEGSVGSAGTGEGQFSAPSAVAVDAHNDVWVADTKNNRIEELNENGRFLQAWGVKGKGVGQLDGPTGLALDGQGDVWVADTKANRVEEFTETGTPIRAFGSKGAGVGQFSAPAGIALDSHGDVWVADTKNDRIEKFSDEGAPITQFGAPGSGAAQLDAPHSLAIDDKGNAWIADTKNNRIAEWAQASMQYSYGASGNLDASSAPGGQTTTYSYNADNEVTAVGHGSGHPEETRYDEAGEVISQTDGDGHTTSYRRNALEEITESEDPLGRTTHATYDSSGRLLTETDPEGRVTHHSYDADGRPEAITYSDGEPSVEFSYDAEGNRTRMVDASGTTTYTYDALNQLIQTKDGSGAVVGDEYDLAGQPVKLTYPNGQSVERSFDHAGRLERVKDWLGNTTRFSYNANSEETSIAFPASTGETDTYTYTPADEVSGVTFAHGSETLASLSYKRNDDGLVTQSGEQGLPGEESTAYSYDERSRLTGAGATGYEYDGAGNPTKVAGASNAFDPADELTSGNGVKYGYDEEGARVKATAGAGPATTYSYNQPGELTAIARPAQGESPKIEDSYVYNGEGLRVAADVSGVNSDFAWDLSGQQPVIIDDGTDSYIYGPEDAPVEQISHTGEVLFLHHDQQGSTRLLSTSAGAVAGTASYNAYGQRTSATGASTPLGYDGEYGDADTGLIYLRARYYDPATAQFLTSDPEVASTHAPYLYGEDEPISNGDPTGLNTEGDCAGLNGELSILNLNAGACVLRSKTQAYHNDEYGYTTTSGGGAGEGLDAAASISFEDSNARRLGGLAGWFHYASAGGEDLAGVAGSVFWSLGTNPLLVYGADLGGAVGEGAEVATGFTDTTVHDEGGLVGWGIKEFIKHTFDAVFHTPIGTVLKGAASVIRQHTG